MLARFFNPEGTVKTRKRKKGRKIPRPRRLRGMLDAQGETLNGLARKTGIGRGQLNAYDRGLNKPGWLVIQRIAAALRLPPLVVADALFERTGDHGCV